MLREENQYLTSRLEAINNNSIHARETVKIEHREPIGYQRYPEYQGTATLNQGQYDTQIAVY